MPSILYVSTVASFLRAFLIPHAEYFRRRGWRVEAMAKNLTGDSECASCFDAAWDIEWSRNPLTASNLLRAPKRVRQLVENGAYDIVHVHTPVAGFVSRLALRHNSRTVKIYTAHGFHFHEHASKARNWTYLALEKLGGRWTDYLITINRWDEAAAKRHRLVPGDRLIYMPGIGVDTEKKYNPALISSQDVLRFRNSIGVGANDPVVLMIAEFVARKRHADALHAWRELGLKNAHLVFAGTGPTTEAVTQLTRQLGLEGCVHFVGMRTDIPVLIKACQAVLLCSDQEGLPRSVMEGLSMGTPVIASDIRGTHELLDSGAGYLYPVGDVKALAQLLRNVISDSGAAMHRAETARLRMRPYDIRQILSLHEDLYSRSLDYRDRRCA